MIERPSQRGNVLAPGKYARSVRLEGVGLDIFSMLKNGNYRIDCIYFEDGFDFCQGE